MKIWCPRASILRNSDPTEAHNWWRMGWSSQWPYPYTVRNIWIQRLEV